MALCDPWNTGTKIGGLLIADELTGTEIRQLFPEQSQTEADRRRTSDMMSSRIAMYVLSVRLLILQMRTAIEERTDHDRYAVNVTISFWYYRDAADDSLPYVFGDEELARWFWQDLEGR